MVATSCVVFCTLSVAALLGGVDAFQRPQSRPSVLGPFSLHSVGGFVAGPVASGRDNSASMNAFAVAPHTIRERSPSSSGLYVRRALPLATKV